MGFWDRLFPPTIDPAEQTLQIKLAIRKAQRFIDQLNAKATTLTEQYDKLWDQAKQYFKVGNKTMAQQLVRKAEMHRIASAKYEEQAAIAAQQLVGLELTHGSKELIKIIGGVAGLVNGTMQNVEAELAKANAELERAKIGGEILMGDPMGMGESDFLGQSMDINAKMQELSYEAGREMALEAQGISRMEQSQTVNAGIQMPRDEVMDGVVAGSARLKKLMEEQDK